MKEEFMSKEHKMVCTTLNYIEHVFIKLLKLHDVFQFLVLLLYLVFLQELRVQQQDKIICAITAGIKNYKSIIKKKKKKHDKVVLLEKPLSNSIVVLFSKTLFDSNISHNEFFLVNNVLKEYDNIKKEIKNLRT